MTDTVTSLPVHYAHQQASVLRGSFTIPRFTIGYVRSEHALGYAWAVVNPKDEYNKKMGREMVHGRMNTERFLSTFVRLHNTMGFPGFQGTNIGEKVGFIGTPGFMIVSQLDRVIADHVRDEMTLMDLKHNFIQSFLINEVEDLIFEDMVRSGRTK